MYTEIPSCWTPLFHPIPFIEAIAEHPAELPALGSRFSPAVSFACDCAHASVIVSQFIPLLPPGSTCSFPVSSSLFLSCKYVHLYHFSRSHTYLSIYDMCFSLSDLLYSVWQTRPIDLCLQKTQYHSFLLVSNIACIYTPHLLYPFVYW